MVVCAFGIMCNKWRIFHRTIVVYPDFCDVIVKTCCILHNFIRQRDGFQFQDTLYEYSPESIKAVGTRGDVTGTVKERGAQGTGITVLGDPVRTHGLGGPFTGNSEIVEGGLWKRCISLYGRCEGNLEGVAPLLWILKVMYRKILVTSIFP
jgi:hypothetical protein